jgi:hypothetical protein
MSQIEKKLEADFARLRSRLEEQVNSPNYPSGETMDRLARILARGLSAPGSLE